MHAVPVGVKASLPRITLDEVAKHAARDDAWIAVDGYVYDITPHAAHHPGWKDPAKSTTVVAIMAYIGKEATQAWHAVHSHADRKTQTELGTYMVGVLAGGQHDHALR
jgi:nitrate reductase (NAD(P)H)